MKKIESPHNAFIRKLVQLRVKSRARKSEQQFLVEGVQEITLAIQADYKPLQMVVCPSILPMNEFEELFKNVLGNAEIIEVTKDVYEKIAYRTSTEGVIAVMKSKDITVKNLVLSTKNPLILVAESPEKPGNLGALLRTADAAGVDAILIANPKTDLYNPNVIRSSVGGLFTITVATGSTGEIIEFLTKKNINMYAAILQEAQDYHLQDFTKATAIVVGTEHEGLTEVWRTNATQNIKIPMSGKIDSMNVSVAAGILIFEAKRQRGF